MNARKFKEITQRTAPFVIKAYNHWKGKRHRDKDAKTIFTDIFTNNLFHGTESISGPGSSMAQTEAIRSELPGLFRKLGVRTLVDGPCGDFAWMSLVLAQADLDYTGLDIVERLIQDNERKFGTPKVRFLAKDLISDPLPKADCVLCRDCLVHLSNDLAGKVLRNFQRSGARYLLSTTYPKTRCNVDILTGMWHAVNLQEAPFNLPAPTEMILENCTEAGGSAADKTLALFDLHACSVE